MKAVLLVLIIALCGEAAGVRAQEWSRPIYPPPEQAQAQLTAALHRAAQEHKRVLVDFGGNWCGDCKVLDYYMHQPENAALLAKNYVVVDVNIGEYDRNLALAQRYEIPLKRGVPAVAILSEHGKLLYSQKQGEFESMKKVDPRAVTDFLLRWRPQRAGCSMMAVNC
jgi:thiol:disulfide interchange protein